MVIELAVGRVESRCLLNIFVAFSCFLLYMICLSPSIRSHSESLQDHEYEYYIYIRQTAVGINYLLFLYAYKIYLLFVGFGRLTMPKTEYTLHDRTANKGISCKTLIWSMSTQTHTEYTHSLARRKSRFDDCRIKNIFCLHRSGQRNLCCHTKYHSKLFANQPIMLWKLFAIEF